MIANRFAILLLLVTLPLTAPAQGPVARVGDITRDSASTRIVGTWPNACQPVIRTRSGTPAGGLDVLLASDGDSCRMQPHPFSIEMASAETFSPAAPAHGVAPVRVFAELGEGTPELVGFAVRGGHAQSIAPDPGFWWPQGDNDGSGNVLSLEVQGSMLGIALLTHDDLSGAPVWYFGTSNLDGRVAHARLTRLADGSSPFFGMAVRPTPEPGWTLDLAFDSSTRARVWLTRPSPVRNGQIDLASMTFARRSFSNEAQPRQWLGTWLVAHDADAREAGAADWPNRLEFTRTQQIDSHRMRLIDRNGDFALDCRHNFAAAMTAQQCTLLDAAGNALAHFDQVGLQRLDGSDRQARAVVLMRPRQVP